MNSILLACLLVLELGFGQPIICLADQPRPQLKLKHLPLKQNYQFTFKINNRESSTNIIRNQQGTFFQGNFSTLQLTGYNETFVYHSKGFSFKYPAQHIIAQLTQEVIQMQIIYELQQNMLRNWKHKKVAISVSFVVTNYAPQGGFTLKQQIKPTLKNGAIISFDKLLPLVSGLNMILYKGIHSEFAEDKSFLWLVRPQLLLMSQLEYETLKNFIFKHIQQSKVTYHGLLKKTSDLNQIRQTFQPKRANSQEILQEKDL